MRPTARFNCLCMHSLLETLLENENGRFRIYVAHFALDWFQRKKKLGVNVRMGSLLGVMMMLEV